MLAVETQSKHKSRLPAARHTLSMSLELENRYTANCTVVSNSLLSQIAMPRELIWYLAYCGNADTRCTAIVLVAVQINCEPSLSIKSNAEPLQS